ncbi:MAG: hypothetical protein WKF90_08270 [Pyrinomonadaceae bacterium]
MRNEHNTNKKQKTIAAHLREFLVVFGLASAGFAIGHILALLLIMSTSA